MDHDGHWQVESCYGRPECNRRVGEELDVALTWQHGSPTHDELPEQDGRSPQDEGQHPGSGDHQAGHLGAAACRVAERFGDTEVPVKADDEQVHDRGVADDVINSQPQVADHSS